MTLSTEALVVSYADRSKRALDRVSIEVRQRRTLAVVGPSGAGKTTLLRAIAGLLRAGGGDVRLDGRSIAALAPQARRIALVFQDDALFANMTVRENLRFAMRERGRGHDADDRIAATAIALHAGEHLDRRPRALSGGERQRASIARALLSDPRALLLDEPLAHLDPSLRRSVRDEVIGVRERYGGPIVYVTHDHVEAMSIGDELAVLIDGKIEDIGEPQRVYDAPRTVAVARFLGERPMNLLPDGQTILGIRPEHLVILSGAREASAVEGRSGAREASPSTSLRINSVEGRVVRREPTGADAYLHVATERGGVVVRVAAAHPARTGDAVALGFPAQFVRRFDTASGVALA